MDTWSSWPFPIEWLGSIGSQSFSSTKAGRFWICDMATDASWLTSDCQWKYMSQYAILWAWVLWFSYFLLYHAHSSCIPSIFHIATPCPSLMLQRLRPTAQHMFSIPLPYVVLPLAMMMLLGLQTIQQYRRQSLVKASQVLVQMSLQECQLFRLVLS